MFKELFPTNGPGMCLLSHCLARIGVGGRGVHRWQGELISFLSFFKNKESRLKIQNKGFKLF
jgi:hypothetical protein